MTNRNDQNFKGVIGVQVTGLGMFKIGKCNQRHLVPVDKYWFVFLDKCQSYSNSLHLNRTMLKQQ